MYSPDNSYKTIRKAQRELLQLILDEGEEVEETLEITNISVCFINPCLYLEDLDNLVTPIAQKHMSQMMIEKNCKSDKTHYERLHIFKVDIYDNNGDHTHYIDQIEEIIKKLQENPLSKRCVLTLWSPEDCNDKYATSWVFSQLFIRNNKLIMTNYFRSCDLYNAFPWNVLGTAKLQKEISQELGVEVGEFIVYIGSCHIYKNNLNRIKEYLELNK